VSFFRRALLARAPATAIGSPEHTKSSAQPNTMHLTSRTAAQALSLAGFALFGQAGLAQSGATFQHANTQIPSGPIFNAGYTENVDFGDVDGDGDFDAVFADGGDQGDQQNRIWINKGFEAGGTIGFFADRSATQFPVVTDDSRDIEFGDFDNDGDLDIYVSNTSNFTPQSNNWWINMGGAQGGTPGFYQDQTAAHWIGLGGAGSSIAPTQVLGTGGFIDFSCDCDFGDLDNDGDLDLAHSTYGGAFGGQVPTRLFLNNGGNFTEFNPSGFQLAAQAISNGNPGLWAMGTQAANTTNNTGVNCDIASSALDIDLGDIDGDLDLDLLHGARQEQPRMFRNRLVENGGVLVAFQDVSSAVFPAGYSSGNGHYEQEMGDCDNDNDIDIYGLNWQVTSFNFNDISLTNNGAGVFGSLGVLPGSGSDDNEADFLDYDNDGDLDVYVANFSGQDRLYRNDFTGTTFSFTNVTGTDMASTPNTALDADCIDLDDDGDIDVMVANDQDEPEYFLKNIRNNADTIAPRLANMEQAPSRVASATPTVIRVQQYDNQSYYGIWYNATVLQYRVVPGSFVSTPMRNSGGTNLFRGTIPGNLVGTVEYFTQSTDNHGNVGTSVTKSFVASCPTIFTNYCTTGTSSSGCVPVLSGVGTPSATAPSGFTLTLAGAEGQKQGLLFYGVSGRKAAIWAPGSNSYLCVTSPTQRTPVQNSNGTVGACDGVYTIDWNAYMFANPGAVGQPLSAGTVVDVQVWYRDPPAPGTTNLSGALEFIVCN
jgi:hypothetical protein